MWMTDKDRGGRGGCVHRGSALDDSEFKRVDRWSRWVFIPVPASCHPQIDAEVLYPIFISLSFSSPSFRKSYGSHGDTREITSRRSPNCAESRVCQVQPRVADTLPSGDVLRLGGDRCKVVCERRGQWWGAACTGALLASLPGLRTPSLPLVFALLYSFPSFGFLC